MSNQLYFKSSKKKELGRVNQPMMSNVKIKKLPCNPCELHEVGGPKPRSFYNSDISYILFSFAKQDCLFTTRHSQFWGHADMAGHFIKKF